jgi:hypothetical protein
VTTNVESWLANASPSGRTVVLLADEHDVTDIELPVVLEQRASYGPPRVDDGLVRAMSDHLYLTILVDQQVGARSGGLPRPRPGRRAARPERAVGHAGRHPWRG